MSHIVFGNPENIEEGTCFPNRAALIEAGLHRYTVHGIDGNGKDGVAAIVLSGGYEDDVDLGDEIIYTGHGGNDPSSKKQIEHQSWKAAGNAGLVLSRHKNLPVRVIRGFKHNSVFSPSSGYKYCGLFRVVENWEEIGKSGFKICRFKLVKIQEGEDNANQVVKKGALVYLEPFGKEPKWFSIGVDAPDSQRLSSESNFAHLLYERKEGEIINFGAGFKILKVRKYLS